MVLGVADAADNDRKALKRSVGILIARTPTLLVVYQTLKSYNRSVRYVSNIVKHPMLQIRGWQHCYLSVSRIVVTMQ